MNALSEENFKIALDGLWTAYAKSTALIDFMEGIGLIVDGGEETLPGEANFSYLYGIGSAASRTILNLLHVEEEKRGRVMEDLDAFLSRQVTCCFNYEAFPTSRYPGLMKIFEKHEIKLPWEENFS